MNDIGEISKAAAETAKFGTQAVVTTERILIGLQRMLGGPASDIMGLIGDKLKFARWQRQVRFFERANEILEELDVENTRVVPPKFALPIITHASLEEEDDLQDIWARLTANAMDPTFDDEIRYAYIEIIQGLNPVDVRILNGAYNSLAKEDEMDWAEVTKYHLSKADVCSVLGIDDEEYQLSMYNLFRVQCMTPAWLTVEQIILGDERLSIQKGVDVVTMTPLGVSFVRACIANRKKVRAK